MSEIGRLKGLCRCCSSNGIFRSLGVSYNFEGTEEVYSVLINQCFGIIVSPIVGNNSAFSYTICDVCIPRLRDALSFKNQVLKCEQNLNELLNSKAVKGPVGDELKEEETHEDLQSYSSDDIEEFEQKKSIKNERAATSDRDDEADERPLALLRLRPSEREARPGARSPAPPLPAAASAGLRCDECGRSFVYRGSLRRHERAHRGEADERCALCGERAVSGRELTRHVAGAHGSGGVFPCTLCALSFERPAGLRRHLAAAHRPAECPHCARQFRSRKRMRDHARAHAALGERRHACALCHKAFAHKATLDAHRLTHTGERPHVCDACGRRFPQRSHVRRHFRAVHLGAKPHACEQCGKSFSSRAYLAVHARAHSGERPFACDACGARFAARAGLAVHARTHSPLKPFACPAPSCLRAFRQRGALRLHERTHSGERPFACAECGARFADGGYLKVHARTHRAERPHACPAPSCARAFREKAQLRRHARTHLRPPAAPSPGR